jgi:transcriptional regulator with XRE-family HTH domain
MHLLRGLPEICVYRPRIYFFEITVNASYICCYQCHPIDTLNNSRMKESLPNWASNLKFLRKRRQLNQDELAAELGITRSKLTAHENGNTLNPTAEDLVRFSSYFGLSIDTLLKVNLATLSELSLRELEAGNDIFTAGTKLRVLATTVDTRNKENMEFVPVKAKAGYLAGYSDPEYIASLPRFSMPHLPANKTYRMFPTTGRSMLPIPEGSLVIAEYVQDWRALKDNVLCILILKSAGHDFVFKQVVNQIASNRSFLLKSLNEEEFQPYLVPVSDVLEVWKFVSYVSHEVPAGNITMTAIASALQDIRVDLKRLTK